MTSQEVHLIKVQRSSSALTPPDRTDGGWGALLARWRCASVMEVSSCFTSPQEAKAELLS